MERNHKFTKTFLAICYLLAFLLFFFSFQWTGFDPAIANIAATWGESNDRDFKLPASLELSERYARRIQTPKVAAQDNQITKSAERLPDKKEIEEVKTSASTTTTTEAFHCDPSKIQRIQADTKNNCQVSETDTVLLTLDLRMDNSQIKHLL